MLKSVKMLTENLRVKIPPRSGSTDFRYGGKSPPKGEHLTFGRVNVAIATLCLEGRQGAIPKKKPWQWEIFLIFTPTWGRFPFWFIFFNWVVQPPTSQKYPKVVSPDLIMILTGLLAKFCAQAVGWAKLVVTKLEKTIDAHEAVGWKDQVGNCFGNGLELWMLMLIF